MRGKSGRRRQGRRYSAAEVKGDVQGCRVYRSVMGRAGRDGGEALAAGSLSRYLVVVIATRIFHRSHPLTRSHRRMLHKARIVSLLSINLAS